MFRQHFIEPHVSSGTRVYAIGDIHGRADLLRRIHRFISDDAACVKMSRKVVIYLGDYIDRGRDSRAVIDLLLDAPLSGFDKIHLKGNHDDCLIRFLVDPEIGPLWLSHGGDCTLRSYRVPPPQSFSLRELHRVQQELIQVLPEAHVTFFRRLKLSYVEGNYFFVHAGIRPGTPLDRQAEKDMLWIDRKFLNSRRNHGPIIVHGHNITPTPDIKPNRIGIDTGAYQTGRLTCLVLQEARRLFLQVSTTDCPSNSKAVGGVAGAPYSLT